MLTVLLESRAARQRRVGSTILSALAHGTVIAAVVALTLPDRGNARQGPDAAAVAPVTYVHPVAPAPDARAAAPRTDAPTEPSIPRIDLPTIDAPVITPTEIPPVDLSVPATTSDQILIGHRSSASSFGASSQSGIPVGGTGGVSDATAVDRAPRILGRAIEPRYPAALRSAGVQGHVLAEFVVDTTGRAELGTLRFPELTNPLFGDAVREALARYRFTPGELAGRKVRTRVAVPFEFRLR